MLDGPLPDEPLGHILLTRAVQLHRQPGGGHGRGEDLRAGLRDPRRQGWAAHKDTQLCARMSARPLAATYTHTHTN